MMMFGSIVRRRATGFRLLHALWVLSLMCATGVHAHAQSDEETDEAPAKIRHKHVVTIPYHRHGGGGVDDSLPVPTLRSDPHSLDRTRWDLAAPKGLALDHGPLPGEMGPAPEPARPLFDPSLTGLATHPDAWEIPSKQ